MLARPDAPPNSDQLQSLEALRRVLARHSKRLEGSAEGTAPGQIRFKDNKELPPAAEGIESPYDLEARFRSRYRTAWIGYLVHLSESCEADQVHLITYVETTAATVHEARKTETIHHALVDKGLPPAQYIVDSTYIDAELLVHSQQEQGIILIGPTPLRPKLASQTRRSLRQIPI